MYNDTYTCITLIATTIAIAAVIIIAADAINNISANQSIVNANAAVTAIITTMMTIMIIIMSRSMHSGSRIGIRAGTQTITLYG